MNTFRSCSHPSRATRLAVTTLLLSSTACDPNTDSKTDAKKEAKVAAKTDAKADEKADAKADMKAPTDTPTACDPKQKPATFEDFKRCVYREPDGGVWIVDGDIPIVDEVALERFYGALVTTTKDDKDDARMLSNKSKDLAVGVDENGNDAKWADERRCEVRYCVSKASTGAKYDKVVAAMQTAAQAWSGIAGTRFVHVTAEDGSCDADNAKVEFDVQLVSGRPYLARAFFPNEDRAVRNVLIDETSFTTTITTLEGILRHELGHALGFRHEHTRPEANDCFEDDSWRPLGEYDSKSVMHYPQCNGTAGWALEISELDQKGCVALYGAASTCSP
jgi:serine protease